MTQKQINRYYVIKKSLEGAISVKEAAISLGLSERQIIRLRKGVKEQGPAALIHKNQGRKPKHAFPEEIAERIISLKLSDGYKDANFQHFKELLEEKKNILISYTALYHILTKAGIKSPRKRRRFKPHRRRKRKPQEGILIQMDATPFEWFGDNTKYSLHGAIDDATGKIVGLYLTKNECLQGYFEVTRQILTNYGIPVSIYADRHSIFLSTKAGKLTIEEELAGKVCNDTQFGRAMRELGITLIPARSPQAKGRVERLWNTLQDRLYVEFKLAEIRDIHQANEFLKKYIPQFNNLFAVQPIDSESAYIPLPENLNIDSILCVKEKRILDNGGVFSFYGKTFKVVTDSTPYAIPPKTKVSILVSSISGIKVEYNGVLYDTVLFVKPKKQTTQNTKKSAKYIPPDSHYYKYGKDKFPKLSFEYSYSESIKILEEIFLSKYV